MSLIGRFIEQILPVGSITLIKPDGRHETHGPGGGKHVTVKLHDRKAAFDLFRNPRLRLGELYMDGRLTIEDGTILDLLELVVGAKPWEQGRRKALGKGKASLATFGGGTITATKDGDKIVLTDSAGTKATISASDDRRSNGVVHHVDGILLPG